MRLRSWEIECREEWYDVDVTIQDWSEGEVGCVKSDV